MKKLYVPFLVGFLALLLVPKSSFSQGKADFEALQLDPASWWNGITASYGNYTNVLEDSIFVFENRFGRNDYGYGMYDSWYGFAYSRMMDDTTSGIINQYSAITASGVFGSENYGVFYLMAGKDTIRLSETRKLDSVFVTNGTYPYLSMRDGDSFSKKFGGESGDDPDWFMLSLVGIRNGEVTDTVEVYLADFRDADNENDYIVSEWEKVDLSVLDTVDMIELSLSSSDVGDWGMNTPAYFCLDNLSGADFEDFSYISGDYWNGSMALAGSYQSDFSSGDFVFPNSYAISDYGFGLTESWSGFAYSNMQDVITPGYVNQYSSATGIGVGGSWQYGLCYNLYRDTISLTTAGPVSGMFVTNGTLNVQSMLNGDGFAKKFGGESGNDPDWFLLSIRGLRDGICIDTVSYYLADYRFDNHEEDYIVSSWEWVELSELDTIDQLEFSLSSSDEGFYGMNTPAFFFFDDINDQKPLLARHLHDTLVVNQINTEVVVDLSGLFTDPDDADEQIGMGLKSISGDNIVGDTYIADRLLTLVLTQQVGDAEIVIEATSGGHALTDTFTMTVEQYEAIDMSFAESISVFPNPTSGLVKIHAGFPGEYRLELFDSYGRCLLTRVKEKSTSEIDISDFNTGVYYIKIQSDNNSLVRTIRKL
ncbi:MAG: DUF4465 domain-containing protein [Bacteroidales bacterium]|nr:DUF4465 domain-containing protein [Bacteroidales bacterium]